METQNKPHPSTLHLAALALGKLKRDAVPTVQSHLDECDECRRFVSDTPRDELAKIVRQGRRKSAAEQNTQATGLSGTVVGAPPAALAPSAEGFPRFSSPEMAPQPASGVVQHGVDQREIPHDLFTQSKYRIIRVLGRGGMGTVYEAEHVRMTRLVAIKVINPELVDHPQALLRFEKEIKAVASLDHANIARAFDAENIGALQVFVMEFVRGQTLYEFLRSRGRLSVMDGCRCVRQALLGLQHAHEQGLVHRDLKPQNLMLTRDTGQIKILDFGLAKAVSENRQSHGLTHSRATMGTYAYMAPEQALDAANADIRADIYSLGCTLYLLLSGVLPFNYDVDTKLLLAHQNETPRPLHEFCPTVPRALSDLVARMLAKNPDDRPRTPREAADALLPFAKGQAITMPATPAAVSSADGSGRRVNARMLGGIAAALLVVFGFGGWAAGLFSVRTPDGTITVQGLPEDADVSVDDRVVTVTRSGDSATIAAVKEGPHHLKVVQGGREVWSNDVMIKVAGESVRAIFEPPAPLKNQPVVPGAPSSESTEAGPSTRIVGENDGSISEANKKFPDAVIQGGVWRIDGDELVQSEASPGPKSIIFGDSTWSDYDMAFKAMSNGPTQGFITRFHLTGLDEYRFEWGGWGNKADDMNFTLHGKLDRNPGLYHKRSIEFNRWYDVVLSVRGSHFKCYVDQELISTDSHSEFTRGRVGFTVWDGTARFKDIEIKSPDGKLLWKGLPRLPGSAIPVEDVDATAAASSSKDEHDGFTSIFNGKDFTGWTVDGDDPKSWTVEQGVILAHGADYHTRNYLLTTRDYDNYILRLEFSMEAGSNAAVAVRAIPGEIMAINGNAIFDHPIFKLVQSGLKEKTGITHWIFPTETKEPDQPVSMPSADSWNKLEMEVRGNYISVSVNDSEVVHGMATPNATFSDGKLPGLSRAKGRIGMQKHTGLVRYRNIEVKELSADSSRNHPKDSVLAKSDSNASALLQPRSIWKGPRRVVEGGANAGVARPCELSITTRDAGTFAGTVYVQEPRAGRANIEGRIDGENLTWTEDVRNRTVTVRAKLDPTGKAMRYTFHTKFEGGGTHEGEGQLTLEPSGSEAPSGNDINKLKKVDAATDAQQESAADSAEAEPPSTKDEDGFVRLFNGKNLKGWIDAVDSFEVLDGAIRCKPGRRGNLLTKDSYRNFIVRFEYLLPPGGNNGLALRMKPNDGDAAYNGMEVQVLDDSDPQYANIKEWQFDGSLYGLVPAKRGFRRPVGQWNEEQVTLKGDHINVVLNGTEILDADIAEARKNPLDGKEHPGAAQVLGHIGFCGHDSPVGFRNIRIRRLPTAAASSRATVRQPLAPKSQSNQFVSLFNHKDLTGWEPHGSQPGDWKVLNGVIVGNGGLSYLYTTKSDFENFHLRIEARIANGVGGGLFFRCGFGPVVTGNNPGGYEAQIDNNGTGSLFAIGSGRVDVPRALIPQKGQWFTQEVIADGNHIVELVNGKQTAEYVDPQPQNARGRIALQVDLHEHSVMEFRAVEVQELPATKAAK